MKILHLSKVFSPSGGVGSYVLRLCRAQVDAGHEVFLIHSDEQAVQGVLPESAMRQVKDFHLYEDASNEQKTEEVMAEIDRISPDVVHIQNNQNLKLEKVIQEKYPATKSIHVYDYCPSGNKFHHASGKACQHATSLKCLPRMLYKRCTTAKDPAWIMKAYKQTLAVNAINQKYAKVLVASQFVKNEAVKSGYAASQVEVLNYFAEKPEESQGISNHKNIIMFSGRVFREKGIFLLLKVIKRIPQSLDYELVIDGDGPALEQAKKMARSLGVQSRVRFVGWLGAAEHKELYKEASIVVFPSIWPEPFGLVGIEAMSYAKPVVAFDHAGVKEWLRNGVSGYAVTVNDEKAMADKLQFLLENRSHAQAMGEQGKEIFESNFTADNHVKKLQMIYKEVRRAFNRSHVSVS